jgi:DNA-directed RNA polymerase specialized sigma24 family protein
VDGRGDNRHRPRPERRADAQSTGPARGEIDEAGLKLLAKHGAQILATARRYATTPEDAEDAYQRGFEILLTKAPRSARTSSSPG